MIEDFFNYSSRNIKFYSSFAVTNKLLVSGKNWSFVLMLQKPSIYGSCRNYVYCSGRQICMIHTVKV